MIAERIEPDAPALMEPTLRVALSELGEAWQEIYKIRGLLAAIPEEDDDFRIDAALRQLRTALREITNAQGEIAESVTKRQDKLGEL